MGIACTKKIRKSLNSGETCNHLVQALLSSRLGIKMFRTLILSVVLYGFEAWRLTLTEEHRLMLFANRVLRKIFGSKRDEVSGDWRKLHSEELPDLYFVIFAC
jgi:dolichol kinase